MTIKKIPTIPAKNNINLLRHEEKWKHNFVSNMICLHIIYEIFLKTIIKTVEYKIISKIKLRICEFIRIVNLRFKIRCLRFEVNFSNLYVQMLFNYISLSILISIIILMKTGNVKNQG